MNRYNKSTPKHPNFPALGDEIIVPICHFVKKGTVDEECGIQHIFLRIKASTAKVYQNQKKPKLLENVHKAELVRHQEKCHEDASKTIWLSQQMWYHNLQTL